MGEIKKIMAAIAFSKFCRDIIDYAAKLATELDAQLIVTNIINARDVQAISSIESMGYQIDTEDYIKGVKEERGALLDEIMKNIDFPKDKLKVIFKTGHPFDKLKAIIVDEGIDLVVMGTKGRTDLEHVIMGSVSEKMIRHSPVPVLVTRSKTA